MAKSCRLSPVVFQRNGRKVEEKDSKLFKAIKDAVKDNETAWNMWAFTKSAVFKDRYKEVEYDELGEVTFPSLIKALGMEETYNEQKSKEEVIRDYGFEDKVFHNSGEAVAAINDFNSKEDSFVAIIRSNNEGYRIEVLPKKGANIQAARDQSYNYALTGEIIRMLNSLGFSVGFASDPKYDGLFNPENASLHDGLLQVISIAKGERGEQALPEEFAHLIIEGLIHHPLVKRLLDTLDDSQIREVLGDSYERYFEEYSGDSLKLQKEAAGQLLAQHIKKQGTISAPAIQPRKPLLSRIWQWAKKIFSKITDRHLNDARVRAYNAVDSIYNLIASGEAIPLIDSSNIIKAETLYAINKEYDTKEKIAVAGEAITAKMLQSERRKRGNQENIKATSTSLQKIKDYNEADRPFEAIHSFLEDAERQIGIINEAMMKAKEGEKEGWQDKIHIIKNAAKVAREIDTLNLGYSGIINFIRNLDTLSDDEKASLGLNENEVDILAQYAETLNKLLNKLTEWRAATSSNIMLHASRSIYGKDKVRGIGSNRQQIMSLEQIMDHASRDINFVDRWLTALSDADDPYLTLFDGIVKNQQYERDMEMIEWNAKIASLEEALRKAGYSSDFMYERDADGVPTGRIISEYDWESFLEARNAYRDHQRELQKKNKKTDAEVRQIVYEWETKPDKETGLPRKIKIYVDPVVDKLYREQGEAAVKSTYPEAVYEMVPNPAVFDKKANTIENLSQAQKDYYYGMMEIKRQMMAKIPHRGQGIYKVVYISKDFIEGVIDNTTGNPFTATVEHYKKKFVRRPDDIGFGTSENFEQIITEILQEEKDSDEAAKKILNTLAEMVDEDILVAIHPDKIKNIINRFDRQVNSREITAKDALKFKVNSILDTIVSENFYIVDTDFADHTIQQLPIYYTRPLKDKRMLSTDFSGSMVAYSAMAVNYEKMNEVIDILEVGRSYAKERAILATEGNKPLMSKFIAFNKIYKRYVLQAGASSAIAARLDDYMDSVVYEERKKNEGTVDILGTNIDIAKTLDAIKDYTGILGLGFNLFSTVSNLAVGKLQQWIEAVAGEYFTVKDYAKAVGQYTELMYGMNGAFYEMASPVKKNKLSLLIQMFDPMGDYFESLRDANYNKSAVSRILGNGALAYVGMNAGEHILHCQTMLAILNNIKVIDKDGNKISLFDALEVVEKNGITKLELKEGLHYERELIDNTGESNPERKNFNKNYGKPLRDENGKIKTEKVELKGNETSRFLIKKKRIIRKVNDSLNGAFGVNDKGAFHKMAVGRLVMQFRQWMPAHYERRFARAHYDNDLEQWREGYYVTVGKVVNQMRKELKESIPKALTVYNKLSEHEKANLRRASAEITEFVALTILVKLGGKVKDRDRSWLDKMALYQIRRMALEVGASSPVSLGDFFDNIKTILQSPAPAITTYEKLAKILNLYNMFEEIERGRYQGWSEWERDAFNAVPAAGQIMKAVDFDESMFSMYERED